MTLHRRYALFLAGGIFLLLVLIFQQFLIANVVLPIATVVWALLRIFVLSIDQRVYWWILIGILVLVPLIRELRDTAPSGPERPSTANWWLERVDFWRGSILANVREAGDSSTVKHNLVWLLASLYATGQQKSPDYGINMALQQGESGLPDYLRAFLWPPPRPARPPFFKHPVGFARHTMHSLRAASALRIRRWTGREAAEYYRAIELVLAHMETSLEMRNDDTPHNP
jgi:hypothetical protein